MDLNYISSAFGIVHVIISVIVGSILISKYFKSKDKTLIFVGLVWIIIVEPWIPASLNLIYISFDTVGLPYQISALITNLFLPVGLILWTLVITELVFKKIKTPLLIIFIIFGIIFYSLLFYSVILDISIIIDIPASVPLNMRYNLIWMVFQTILVVIVMVTGLAFSWTSIKHDNPEIKLRGKILGVAFISFLIGALLAIVNYAPLGNTIMITSSIEFYLGYILPDWIKDRWL